MVYRYRENFCNEDVTPYLQKQLLGIITREDVEKVDRLCKGIKPLRKQVDLRGRQLDLMVKLYRCIEWVDDFMKELDAQGILMKERKDEGLSPAVD